MCITSHSVAYEALVVAPITADPLARVQPEEPFHLLYCIFSASVLLCREVGLYFDTSLNREVVICLMIMYRPSIIRVALVVQILNVKHILASNGICILVDLEIQNLIPLNL